MYQKNKFESKVKFGQASNGCKRVLEAAKLAYATKTKESIFSQKLRCQDFWQTPNSVYKGKSAIPPVFNSPEVLSFSSDKPKFPRQLKKIITNLDSSNASGPDLIPVVVLKAVSLNFQTY